jgi:deoxyribodipyrimidine photo-lyase
MAMPSSSQPPPLVMWFRRDLRRRDNPALLRAIKEARARQTTVLPLFIVDPALVKTGGANRLEFLRRSLQSLSADGVPMVFREGEPVAVFNDLARNYRSPLTIVCTADFGPYGRRRDENVRDHITHAGGTFIAVDSPFAVPPGTVRKLNGFEFKVFTPFHKVWLNYVRDLVPAVPIDPSKVDWCRSVPSDSKSPITGSAPIVGSARGLPDGGERAAHDRWALFCETHLAGYDEARNVPAADATSRLSADLKYGTIGPRQLLPELRNAEPGSGAWVFRSELAWRDFYADVMWHHPESARRNLQSKMDAIRLDEGPVADQRFQAWCEGRTGFPFIDAAMRQLLSEGWMHNRARMAVASFLVKDLHLDWRWGARWFMQNLVDGDLASNQHGWQWTAGTGTDAAPYFRIFNPTNQGRTHDPDGTYIRRYVEELANFTGDIHEPHVAPKRSRTLFDSSKLNYPHPIVDHSDERDEALARYRKLR